MTDTLGRMSTNWERTMFSNPPARSEEHISYDSMREIMPAGTGTKSRINLPDHENALIGWHSCRKTRADQEFNPTGDLLAKVRRRILGHTEKSKSTKFYLTRPPATNQKP